MSMAGLNSPRLRPQRGWVSSSRRLLPTADNSLLQHGAFASQRDGFCVQALEAGRQRCARARGTGSSTEHGRLPC